MLCMLCVSTAPLYMSGLSTRGFRHPLGVLSPNMCVPTCSWWENAGPRHTHKGGEPRLGAARGTRCMAAPILKHELIIFFHLVHHSV